MNERPHDFDDHLGKLLIHTEKTWWESLADSIREQREFKRLPPLQLTSKPVAVREIWGDYRYGKVSGPASLAIHALVLLVMVVAGKQIAESAIPIIKEQIFTPLDIAPYVAKPGKSGGGGGGGDRSLEMQSKGKLPRNAMEQFTPPTAVIRNENPMLPMEATLIAPPDLKLPTANMDQMGDPLAKLSAPSNGPGSGGGIGSGSGGGVGPGRGGGFGPGEGGGFGGGVFRVGGGVSAPQLVFRVEPEYTEAARKAKYQGTVVLYAVVDADGKVRDVRVQRALGLGLDEKAIEAVRQWRFRPGQKDGKAVAVQASIEVTFRLL